MAINLRQLLLERASRGIGTGGGLMGNQNSTGLLGNINPNLLLGANIIGAGLQGRDPFSSLLPAVTQKAQTQAFLSKAQEEEKKRKYIKKYGETIPEGTERDLFNLDPAGYIKNKLTQKKPNLINMIGGDQKTQITLNLSNKEDLQKFRELKSQGFYEVGK